MKRRESLIVSGLVQGVGFRPFVYRLASQLGLTGFVRNEGSHVSIEVEGESESIEQFRGSLVRNLPPLARVDEVRSQQRPVRNDSVFEIISSDFGAERRVSIGPDVATCADCLTELFDPRDRRHRYPFLNCTNCGPRLTIITGVPYDRARTTMSAFAMCAACRREYEDPSNRRFHAEPTACPVCGPQLRLIDAAGRPIPADDPLAMAVEALRRGQIVAVKGLGGCHLACRAADESAVATLRQRKHRDEKPFALMVRDLAAAEAICEVSEREARLLEDAGRPIVLLWRRSAPPGGVLIAPGVAPGNPYLGVMLPYTPLHHLLMADLAGEPLVMTSGNRSDEPIAYEDADALDRLRDIADCFLTHDRAIHLRCDDSIVRSCRGEPLMLRRSRGYVPQPLTLPMSCPGPILAVGGQLKAVFALGSGDQAILGPHGGDLDDLSAFRAYLSAIEHFERFFELDPRWIVHDLHPDYASTRYAVDRCDANKAHHFAAGTPPRRLGVQHHHAHLASCLADNQVNETVIGVIFDGTGYGTDGAIWGGEFLVGDCRGFQRAAHLRYVPMPGGDQAIREPWRMAAAHLRDATGDDGLLEEVVADEDLDLVGQMISRRLNAPMTSSVGRLFDAVAALAGVRRRVTCEGQAAVELEWLASSIPAAGHYPWSPGSDEPGGENGPLVVDTRPLIAAIAADVKSRTAPAVIARRFHASMVEMTVAVCRRLRRGLEIDAAALSGGAFMNVILLEEVSARLESEGFRVYRHRRVPPNDGGLSFGQLAVAAAQTQNDPPARAG